MNNPIRVILLSAVVAAALAGCKTKGEEKTPPPSDNTPPPVATQPATDGRYDASDLETDSCLRQRVVYFDFDMSEIKPEFQAIMACHGKFLRDVSSARVTLEGHADERGTREYNLGLGERRGNAVWSALAASGGSSAQGSVVSYGEERPTCADSMDDCWDKNRRVEIVYTAK